MLLYGQLCVVPTDIIYFLDILFSRLLELSLVVRDQMTKTLHSEGQVALVAALTQARKDAGLSQTELAARLRCHQSFVARVESGQRRIDVPELVLLCRAVEVDAVEVLMKVIESTPEGARI